MLHPLFLAALRKPHLLARHLANYGALVRAELAAASHSLVVRGAAAVLAVIAVLLAIGLGGVAVMLGVLNGRFDWVLAIVPGAGVLLAFVAVLVAMRSTLAPRIDEVHDEVETDLHMLRRVKELKDE